MTNLDYILIALFALFLLVAFIRGLKHRATRFEGSFFAFLLAFFLAMVLEAVLYSNNDAYKEFYLNFTNQLTLGSFSALGPWILSLAWLIVLFIPFYFLFRFLHRFANRRSYAFILTLFTYLFTAYVLGLLIVGYMYQDPSTVELYSKSLLAAKLYPDNDTILSFLYFFTGVLF
jgi:hypothetical protein